MCAAVLRDPEQGLQMETLRTPHPKSGEVLIKVVACVLTTGEELAEINYTSGTTDRKSVV